MTASALTNSTWLKKLQDPEEQSSALQNLRGYLLRGMNRGICAKGGGLSFCEDVIQNALMKIMRSLDKFEGRSRFTTWAMSIAVRQGVSDLRRKHFQDVSLDQVTNGDDLKIEIAVDDKPSVEDQLEHQALLKAVQEAIDTELTDKQRTALRAIIGGMPVEEIATRTDSNRNAVYKLIHDARTRLKKALQNAGYSPDDLQSVIA